MVEPKTVTTLNLSDTQIERLKDLSRESGSSVSSLARRMIASNLASLEARRKVLVDKRAAEVDNFERELSETLEDLNNFVKREEFDNEEWIREELADGTIHLLCKDGQGTRKGDLMTYNFIQMHVELKNSFQEPFKRYRTYADRYDAHDVLKFNAGIIEKHHMHRRVQPRDHNKRRSWFPVDTYVTAELILKNDFQDKMLQRFSETVQAIAKIDAQLERLAAEPTEEKEVDEK